MPKSKSPSHSGGGCGIRTREGVNPTRFPSVRHRPLGESSARKVTGNAKHELTGRPRSQDAAASRTRRERTNRPSAPPEVGDYCALDEVTGV